MEKIGARATDTGFHSIAFGTELKFIYKNRIHSTFHFEFYCTNIANRHFY
ncbi:hypothetical protein [Azospirillum doebereinerae]